MMKKHKAGIAAFALFAAAIGFSLVAWADAENQSTSIASPDNNGGPNGPGYTDKSYHDGGRHIYKHPSQPSFTGPFDYGTRSEFEAPRPVPTGECNCFIFDATKSYDVDGQKLTVMWDFGDGATSDQAVVNHCFEKSGTYNVTLTVRDSSGMVCDTGVTSTKVDANFPATADAGPDKQACVGETISYSASSNAGTGPYTYNWDFGDGETAQGATVSHAYQKAGQYRVLVTADDGKNTKCSTASDTTTARIFQNAFVSVKGTESACIGQTVSFDAEGSGGKYRWDFGDGETWEGGSRASHSYQKAGSYTVSVNVDDGRGSSCSTASAVTRVTIGQPPIARISDVTSCLVNEPVNFDGSASEGSSLNYRWDFGDGESAEGVKVSHTFKKAGSYRVILTVSDSSGSACGAANASIVVPVNNRPEAVIEVR